jgi:hypothetical protein
MREVEVAAVLDASRAEVEERLSPESIVEYAGTYAVRATEEGPDGRTVLTAEGENIEAVLEFTRLENGYAYTQRGEDGPFEEMRTRITVDGDGETRVSVRSEFTFGGPFAFVTDWLGRSIRRDELERLLVNLASDLEPDGADG